jgi:UV DNA damage endonuclease
MVELGYCCINLSLKSDKISTNRGMIKRTFQSKGIKYASELALENCNDLYKILQWNVKNNIKVYRLSSSIFPWMSEYEIKDLPHYESIKKVLIKCGDYIKENKLRTGFHPGPFNVLGSPNQKLIAGTIKELDQHAEIMDIMGLEQSYQYPINIHCNGSYGDKKATLKRWCENYKKLSESTQKRLVIENDDKINMYSVLDLYHGIYKNIGIPITFDYFHHKFNTGGLVERDAFHLAYSTWPESVVPLFHYSSSRKINEDNSVKEQAHSDYIYEKINNYGKVIDIEVEAKMKELSIIKYKKEFV